MSNFSYIESILQRLLIPDSAAIKQATKQLLEFFVSEKCVTGLFEVLKSSLVVQNRIYAATLLRKKVKNWKTFQEMDKTLIHSQIIGLLTKENDENVRKQIMYLIASTYKYMILNNQEWNELLTFINSLILSSSAEQHISGIYMLSILNEESAEQMKPHFLNIFKLFEKILMDTTNLKSSYYVLNCLKSIIPFTDETELTDLTNLLPAAITASIKIIKQDENEEAIVTVFDFFQSFIEYDIPMIAPFIKQLTEMMFEFIVDAKLKKSTRICSINFLNVLIETQKSNLLKNEMISPILNTAFTIMFQSKEPLQTKSDLDSNMLDENDEEDENDDDSDNLFTVATQILDYSALYFPAKKFVKQLIDIICPASLSENHLHRRAALAALAVTVEGCADFYRNHYLEMLVNTCIKGMLDTNNQVVQVSYFALCQFSEFLQPNLLKFSSEIMRILISNLETKEELNTISRFTIRFYDALQSFCENLGEELEPYLPTLMEKLLYLQNKFSYSFKFQRLIMSTFSAIVASVKAHFNPYFDSVISIVKSNLCFDQNMPTLEPKSAETKLLKIECINLMGVFARCINKEKFTEELVKDNLAYVQDVLLLDTDAEIRSAVYDLLTGLTTRMQENLPLKQIISPLLDSLRSEEGVNIIDAETDRQADAFGAFDEIDLLDEEDDEEEYLNYEDEPANNNDDEDALKVVSSTSNEENQKLIIENDYLAEKLSSMICLQEICKYPNMKFIDHFSDCYEEIKNLTEFVDTNVKKEAFMSMAYMIGYFHDYCMINFNFEKEELNSTLKKYLKDFNTKAMQTIRFDTSRTLVWNVFDSVKTLLNKCYVFIKKFLNEYTPCLESYGSLIFETFDNKILCQVLGKDREAGEDEVSDYEDNQAEFDYLLKEYAGDLVPSLALCLNQNHFESFFDKVLQHLLHTLNKPNASIAEKSFVIGVVGETLSNLDVVDDARAQLIFKEFYNYVLSTESEIRSNTIFTIGVLCSKSGKALEPAYPQIIANLIGLLPTETHKQTLDNICGTLCHLFIACYEAEIKIVDYELMLNTIFDLVPLKVDYNEYLTFYILLDKIIASNPTLPKFYSKIVELSGHVLYHKQYECKKGIKELIISFLKYFNKNYTNDLDMLLMQIKAEYSNEIRLCLCC